MLHHTCSQNFVYISNKLSQTGDYNRFIRVLSKSKVKGYKCFKNRNLFQFLQVITELEEREQDDASEFIY